MIPCAEPGGRSQSNGCNLHGCPSPEADELNNCSLVSRNRDGSIPLDHNRESVLLAFGRVPLKRAGFGIAAPTSFMRRWTASMAPQLPLVKLACTTQVNRVSVRPVDQL